MSFDELVDFVDDLVASFEKGMKTARRLKKLKEDFQSSSVEPPKDPKRTMKNVTPGKAPTATPIVIKKDQLIEAEYRVLENSENPKSQA